MRRGLPREPGTVKRTVPAFLHSWPGFPAGAGNHCARHHHRTSILRTVGRGTPFFGAPHSLALSFAKNRSALTCQPVCRFRDGHLKACTGTESAILLNRDTRNIKDLTRNG